MPGFVAFRRRWLIGSDDLNLPAVLFLIGDTFWAIASMVALPTISVERRKQEQQHEGGLGAKERGEAEKLLIEVVAPDELRTLRLVMTLSVFLLIAAIIVEGAVAYVSTRGSIFRYDKRRRIMPYLVYVRTGILALQLMLGLIGLVWLGVEYYYHVKLAGASILIGVTIWHLLTVCCAVLLTWCAYDGVGRRWLDEDGARSVDVLVTSAIEPTDPAAVGTRRQVSHVRRRLARARRIRSAYEATWDRRLRRVFYCSRPSDTERIQGNLKRVSALFAEFFDGHDLVASDILAGMILLRRSQKEHRQQLLLHSHDNGRESQVHEILSGIPITADSKFLDLTKRESFDLVDKVRYYMRYALATYGWPFYLNENREAKCCYLFRDLRCCQCCCDSEDIAEQTVIHWDNCCLCNSAALRLTLPPNVRLIYANFHCAIGLTPFYVAADENRGVVVVCLRGTLSLKDLITDLCVHPKPIPLWDEEEEERSVKEEEQLLAHEGAVNAAANVYRKLRDEKLLERAFEQLPNGSLVVVGHSLGGAAASVLCLMLMNKPLVSQSLVDSMKCFVFSPPGAVLSRRAMQLSRTFVTSVVVGRDVVPCLGLNQANSLRNDMMALLRATTDTKWKIIGQVLPRCCCWYRRVGGASSSSSVFCAVSQGQRRRSCSPTSHSAVNRDVEGDEQQEANLLLLQTLPEHRCRLYPPGKLLHIVRRWRSRDGSSSADERSPIPCYSAVWTDWTCYNRIQLSPVMIHDHMPEGVIDALDGLLSRCRMSSSSASSADVEKEKQQEQAHQLPMKMSTAYSIEEGESLHSQPAAAAVHDDEWAAAKEKYASTPVLKASDLGQTTSLRHIPPPHDSLPALRAESVTGAGGKQRSVDFSMGPGGSSQDFSGACHYYQQQGSSEAIAQAWTDYYDRVKALREEPEDEYSEEERPNFTQQPPIESCSCEWAESLSHSQNNVGSQKNEREDDEGGPAAALRAVATFGGRPMTAAEANSKIQNNANGIVSGVDSPTDDLGKAVSVAWIGQHDLEKPTTLQRCHQTDNLHTSSIDSQRKL